MTRQKACVLDVIRGDKCHHTADEIFALAAKRLPGISRATVYNNLKALAKDKLIRRITAEGAADRYDSSYIPHGHLFCTECGRVVDFEIPDFSSRLMAYTDGRMDSYELKVRYVCKECAESE
ncbi:MAG: transcriptional repressor [Ruminococcaceae bacterium]|nr:transcriptional repressor [Oscillospiraceae bacterium]